MTFLVKAMIAKVLLSDATKKAVFSALEAETKKTDTKLDDNAVAVAKAIWDVVIPALCK